MAGVEKVRIDKWLWAVRMYHTRSLAIQACTAGHVKIKDERVKPARPVRPGDVITALTGGVPRTVRVRALLERRVGAKIFSLLRREKMRFCSAKREPITTIMGRAMLSGGVPIASQLHSELQLASIEVCAGT